MDPAHIAQLRAEQEKAIADTDQKIAQWKKFLSDYKALHKRLKTLPDKLSHDILVPFGSLAFMPGRLVHTNEILVLLGDNWFVEQSAKQAAGIVDRRIKGVEKNIEELYKQRKLISPRVGFTSDLQAIAEEQGGMREIVEEYDPVKEEQWKEQHKKNVREWKKKLKQGERVQNIEDTPINPDQPITDEVLCARLNQLEKIETERRELEKLTADEISLGEAIHSLTETNEDNKKDGKTVQWKDDDSKEESDDGDEDTSTDDYDSDSEGTETPGPETHCTKRITFSHTKINKEDVVGSQSEKDGITSPGDIYEYFNQPTKPKSILKKKTKVQRITKTSDTEDECVSNIERVPQSEGVKAFTGTVVEKPTSSVSSSSGTLTSSTQTAEGQPPRRMSKFRAQRQKQHFS